MTIAGSPSELLLAKIGLPAVTRSETRGDGTVLISQRVAARQISTTSSPLTLLRCSADGSTVHIATGASCSQSRTNSRAAVKFGLSVARSGSGLPGASNSAPEDTSNLL